MDFPSSLLVFLKVIIPLSNLSESLLLCFVLTLSMLDSSFFLTPLERSTLFTCFLLWLLLSSLELPSLFALLLFPVVLVLPVLLTCFVLSPLSSCLTLFTLLGLSSFFESLSPPALFISILLLSLLSCLLIDPLFTQLTIFNSRCSLPLSATLLSPLSFACFLAMRELLRGSPLLLFPSLPFLSFLLDSFPGSAGWRFTTLSLRLRADPLFLVLCRRLLWFSDRGIFGRGSEGGISSGAGSGGRVNEVTLLVSVIWSYFKAGQAHAPWHPLLQYVIVMSGSGLGFSLSLGSLFISWRRNNKYTYQIRIICASK